MSESVTSYRGATSASNATGITPVSTTSPLPVENNYSFNNIASATTTVVKSGAGFLHSITINKHVLAGVITIYDNTAASGTTIATITEGAALLTDPPITAVYDIAFSTGLTILTSAAENLTISYR